MTDTVTAPQVWRVPTTSIREWVGPLTATAYGQPVTTFQVAFIQRPTPLTDDATWETPVPHPDNLTTGVGILVGEQTSHLLEADVSYEISVRMELGQSEPVVKAVGVVIGVA